MTFDRDAATVDGGLATEGVTVDFQGLRAVENVSLRLAAREILGLIGPNGAGKTTLVNVLTGFQAPSSGAVSLAGVPVATWPAWRRARAGLARTFQNVLLFPSLSVAENVEAGALGVGASRAAARVRAREVLGWLDLAHLADQSAGSLPFGAERRIGIGRAIAARPRFLLMDEPAAGLNDAECRDLAVLIRRIRSELDCAVLLIEHRMSLVFELCDRVHVLAQGRTLAIGSPQEIQSDVSVRRAYLGEST
jgi:ABC-type branched-subunit amino acid transport system ATPase component